MVRSTFEELQLQERCATDDCSRIEKTRQKGM